MQISGTVAGLQLDHFSSVLTCGATGRADIVANLRNKVTFVPALAKEVESLSE